MHSKRRIFAGAIALSLVAAACGSDDDGDTSEETDGTEAEATETETESTEAMEEETESTEAMEEETESTEAMEEESAGGEAVDFTALSGTIIGAGASSQDAGMQGWRVGFQEATDDNVTVEYDPIGSGGGRERFLEGATMFAGSDAFLKDDEYEASIERCPGDQGAINLPHYISPIAIPFNLDGIDELNLSPELIAGIFANEIENWNDPAIAEINPDVEFPDLAINPVHRSDDSGTTENFTDYMAQTAGDIWTFGPIEPWDIDGPGGGEGGQGTTGVVQAVAAGEGSIGYADASQIGDLPAAKVGVGGEFVEFSPEAAGRIVDASERLGGRNEFDFAIEVNRNPDDASVYPIALVSYHIVCLQYDTQKEVDLIKGFMTYIGSEEGQAASGASAGAAPISEEVRQDILTSLDAITVAG